MKKQLIIALVMVLSLSFLGSTAFTQRRDMEGKMAKKLNLTDAQKEDFLKMRTAQQKEMIGYGADMKKLELDMKDEWASEKPDKKKIDGIMDKIADIRLKMAKGRTDHWFQMYNKLDDNQKKEFKKTSGQFMKAKRDKMGKPGFQGRGMKRGMGKMNGKCPGMGMNPDCPLKNPPPPQVK